MKKKIPKRKRKNPNTPTTKENHISYLIASVKDLFELITKKDIQERLYQVPDDDIRLICYQSNNIYDAILNVTGMVKIR